MQFHLLFEDVDVIWIALVIAFLMLKGLFPVLGWYTLWKYSCVGPLAMSGYIVENYFPAQHQSVWSGPCLNDGRCMPLTTFFLFDLCLANSGHFSLPVLVAFILPPGHLPLLKNLLMICAKLNLYCHVNTTTKTTYQLAEMLYGWFIAHLLILLHCFYHSLLNGVFLKIVYINCFWISSLSE